MFLQMVHYFFQQGAKADRHFNNCNYKSALKTYEEVHNIVSPFTIM